MKVVARRSRLLLRFETQEIDALGELLDQLDVVLDSDDAADEVLLDRLFPAAYRDDDAAEAEYREITEPGLRGERHERIAACRADLYSGDVELTDPDAARRWIQVLNDLRLAIGTRLRIGADGEDAGPDADAAAGLPGPRVVYDWLTYVQDRVVSALMD